jgi:hypothetical protein
MVILILGISFPLRSSLDSKDKEEIQNAFINKHFLLYLQTRREKYIKHNVQNGTKAEECQAFCTLF